MSAQGKWRVGQHYGIHVYEGETAIATFVGAQSFAQENALKAVAAHNAQCEAEPVGWQLQTDDGAWLGRIEPTKERAQYLAQAHLSDGVIRPLYTAPPPPASAVAKVGELRERWEKHWQSSYFNGRHANMWSKHSAIQAADEIIRVLKEVGL